MTTDPSDFLLEEYKQLSEWGRLLYQARRQTMSLLATGLTTLPVVIFGVAELVQRDQATQCAPPAFQDVYSLLALLFALLAGIGFLGLNHLASIRQQMVTNFRTINLIRGYFAEKEAELPKWLGLPVDDTKPRFLRWGGNVWYAALIIFINSVLLAAAVHLAGGSLLRVPHTPSWAWPFAFAASFVLMSAIYAIRMVLAERQWRKPRSGAT